MQVCQVKNYSSTDNIAISTTAPVLTEPLDVLVKVSHAGINYQDRRLYHGHVPQIIKSLLPLVIGYSFAGVVAKVGSQVTQFQPGDHVCGVVPMTQQGALADFVVVHSSNLVTKPESVAANEVASCLGPALFAYTALHYKFKACSGDTLLVTDSLCVESCMATQLALSWDLHVIAVVQSELEAQTLQEICPQVHTLNVATQDLVSTVLQMTNQLGVDYFLEGPNSVPCSPYVVAQLVGAQGVWATCHYALQIDPPQSERLATKGVSVALVNEQAWLTLPTQQGRVSHMLTEIVHKLEKRIFHFPTTEYRFEQLFVALQSDSPGIVVQL